MEGGNASTALLRAPFNFCTLKIVYVRSDTLTIAYLLLHIYRLPIVVYRKFVTRIVDSSQSIANLPLVAGRLDYSRPRTSVAVEKKYGHLEIYISQCPMYTRVRSLMLTSSYLLHYYRYY